MSRRDEDDYVSIEGVFLHESAKAVLIEVDGDEVWIPLSCCHYDGGSERGDEIELEVETWFAEREGLA